jgi:hypothetical protein
MSLGRLTGLLTVRMKILPLLIAGVAVIWTGRASADGSCLPTYTALQALDVFTPGQDGEVVYRLRGQRDDTPFMTHVILRARTSAADDTQVNLSTLFDPEFDGVSLPYNLYSALVLSDGEVAAWWDFTGGCKGPGLSFFPGREVRLPALKFTDHKPHRLQIMLWGRI